MKNKKMLYVILALVVIVILATISMYIIPELLNKSRGVYADDAVDVQKEIKIVVGEGDHSKEGGNLQSIKHIYFLENDVVVDTVMQYKYKENAEEEAKKFGNFAMYNEKVTGNSYMFHTRSLNGKTLEELTKVPENKLITDEKLLELI